MTALGFGFCVPIFAAPGLRLFRTPGYAVLDTATTMGLALTAEALGYDALWVADHLMLGRDEAILEGWTTLAALAGATRRARLGLIHQAHPSRHPALVAKMTATLDQISGGRFTYFLDGGNSRREYLAYGLPWSDAADERIAAMLDGLAVTRALWAAREPVTIVAGDYRIVGAACNPPPVQVPGPPVWFGGVHPAMLRACARLGQGWNTTPVSVAGLRGHLTELKRACAAAGRDPATLTKSLEIQVLIAPDRDGLRGRLRAIAALDPDGAAPDPALAAFIAGTIDAPPAALRETTLVGTPAEVTAQLREYADAGIDHVMLWFLDAPSAAGLTLFAEQVFPAFRDGAG
jgi:alkanesulfonate monooxygenase SsuD/methylene tetrahydromethanopterin reductase-like flavin-dependent oxidoreductase (luciferase family)